MFFLGLNYCYLVLNLTTLMITQGNDVINIYVNSSQPNLEYEIIEINHIMKICRFQINTIDENDNTLLLKGSTSGLRTQIQASFSLNYVIADEDRRRQLVIFMLFVSLLKLNPVLTFTSLIIP